MSTPSNQSLLIAFVQGAKWWEYKRSGFTMWQSDQQEAFLQAEKRLEEGTLGVDRMAQYQTEQE